MMPKPNLLNDFTYKNSYSKECADGTILLGSRRNNIDALRNAGMLEPLPEIDLCTSHREFVTIPKGRIVEPKESKTWKDYECEDLKPIPIEANPTLADTVSIEPIDLDYNKPDNLCQYYNSTTCTHIGDGTAMACVAFLLGELLKRTPPR